MAKDAENSGTPSDGTGNDSDGVTVNPENLIEREKLGTVATDASGQVGFGSAENDAGNGSGESDTENADRYETDENGNVIRNADGSKRKKRGRKPAGAGNAGGTTARKSTRKSGAKKSKADLADSVDNLTMMLATVHVSIASFTGVSELMLDDTEAKSLAKAGVNLAEQFEYTPDPKVEALLTFAAVSATIYGPRFVAIKMRRAEEKRAARSNVVFDDTAPPKSPKKGKPKSGGNPDGILSLAEIEALNNGG